MTANTGQIVRGSIVLVLVLFGAGWVVVKSVKKAEEPVAMIVRWILTIIMLAVLFGVVGRIVGDGGYEGAFVGIPATAVCGLILAIIWRESIAALASKPFTSLFDGGNVAPDPHPLYSVARARQKQGRYLEAVAEVQQQLERFPTDVEGQLLLAEIQAENLKDLPGAELTIDRFCSQPGHAAKNIAFALYSMADWHLKYGQDAAAARRSLERIIQLLPDSEFALGAAQRVAHLGSPEMMLDPLERKKYVVAEGVRHVGLMRNQRPVAAVEVDPQEKAAEYVKHLEQHPLDTEAREQLAIIYADHYGRLDLATSELEQLINCPNQPSRLVVHWLNLLADLQVRSGGDLGAVQETLQRIVDRDPKVAAAEIARKRLALLKLELKGNEKKQAVKMGSYEQNLGLKQARGSNLTN